MPRITALTLTALTLISLPHLGHPEEPSRLRFPVGGFSIEVLEPPSSEAPYQALMMFLQATDGFAPNVNIQVQPFSGSIAEYSKLTEAQLNQMGLTLLKTATPSPSSASYEYAGPMHDNRLHWYARAVKRADAVYLVTATATESQWPRVSPALIRCVNSFRPE